MRKITWPALLALLLVFSLALAACTSGGATTESPAATDEPAAEATVEDEPAAEEPATDQPAAEEVATDEPAAEEPAAEGDRKIATFIWTQEFDTLSPLYTAMWFTTTTYSLWNVWAWQFDENSEPIPVLVTEIPSAENGGISEDGRTLTFNLRDDLVWSDGTPLTSADFVFTYEMSVDPANTVGTTYPYDQIESIEAPDPQTVVVTFTEPFAPWLAWMWHYILPEHVLRPVFDEAGSLDDAEWNFAPTVGVGPYRFEEWESGSFARFVRNENWHGEKPIIDEIFFRFVPDDASQVAALQNGEGDLGTFIAYSDVPALEDAGIGIMTQPSGYNEGWFFILGDDQLPGHPALQDVNVRRAIAMALDREGLNQDLLLGLTKVPKTPWDSLPAYVSPDIEPFAYDPDAANALLDEAGWVDTNGDGVRDKDGVELILVHGTTTREVRQDSQAVAQQQLAEVGIQLDIQSFDSSIFFEDYANGGPPYTGELDLAQWSDAPAFPDPDHYYWLCDQIPTDEAPEGGNFSRICDQELDGLFQQQLSQTNVEDRQQTFHQITQLMHDQVYWLGMWEDPDVWAVSPRLLNVRFSGATPLFSIAEWDIAE
ncbi:MAG: peptide ABC transporter substrate-binding protein [Candidatus Promineofilum sp.]|nr:peptide ABC transporter substrate-binding protein [Promineifilum sp.]